MQVVTQYSLYPFRKCLRPLLSAPSERSHDISHLFDQQLFLKHCPTADSAFFSHFFDTQIFTAFIEQRSFAHSENAALAFFDECTEKVNWIIVPLKIDACKYHAENTVVGKWLPCLKEHLIVELGELNCTCKHWCIGEQVTFLKKLTVIDGIGKLCRKRLAPYKM